MKSQQTFEIRTMEFTKLRLRLFILSFVLALDSALAYYFWSMVFWGEYEDNIYEDARSMYRSFAFLFTFIWLCIAPVLMVVLDKYTEMKKYL